MTLVLPQPYLLFLGDIREPGYAKTAYGLRDWAPERCVGEWALPGCPVSAGLPRLAPAEARAAGARALVIGVANAGGVIAETWIPALVEALEQGLDLVSGMHARLEAVPALEAAARRLGRRLVDVRVPLADIPVATGRRRTGKRLLTVGTDCALGKKYTALALAKAFAGRGVEADFRATGQTGILIAGQGIALDAVVSDFIAGAAEMISPDAAADHWDIVEGQGSLLHPAYGGVSLGLLHGSQPDVVVVCHEPGRNDLLGHPGYPVPPIEEIIDLTLRLGARINPGIRCAGVSLNTARLSLDEARRVIERTAGQLGLPVADPMRDTGHFNQLVEACLQ